MNHRMWSRQMLSQKLLLCTLAVTALGVMGCSSLQSQVLRKQLQENNKRFVGEPKQNLIDAYGEPDAKHALDSGEERWIYRREWVPPGDEAYEFQGEALIKESTLNSLTSSWLGITTFTIGLDGIVQAVAVDVRS